jgi:hypothetical protein
MSATANIADSQTSVRAISARWIIGRNDDLIWFIGSVVSSYVLLGLYLSGWLSLLPMVALWAILIDGPHVFGTISRTYLDRVEMVERRRMLLGSVLFFAVGPVMVLAGFGFSFFFVAALWAYYHLVKQHYGFMVLYKKKNNDLLRVDNALDKVFLLLAFSYPFVAFIERDPEAMARVPPVLRVGVSTLSTLLLAGTIIVALVWSGRQIQRFSKGVQLDLPKYLLLAAAIPMHWIVLLTPMPNKTIAIVAILTVYHNLQYHRLIWFHNRKYSTATDARERYGMAELVSRRLAFYIGFAVLFGLLYQGPRQYILSHESEKAAWMPLATSFLWGFAFIHYYLDSKIWRVRADKALGKALRIE